MFPPKPPVPGFGTILSTAFIHMLLPAAADLSSPCLPESWLDAYEAWAYLFVVLTIVLMQLVDYLVEGAYRQYLARRRGGAPAAALPPPPPLGRPPRRPWPVAG
jgi:hypothetical protein